MTIDFIVEERAGGWVIVRRADGAVMTAPMSRTEAHIEVWNRNGRQVPPPPSWRHRVGLSPSTSKEKDS